MAIGHLDALVESDNGQAGFDRRTMVDRGYCVRLEDGEPYRQPGLVVPAAR